MPAGDHDYHDPKNRTPTLHDRDNDGLSDFLERDLGTNPDDADSDGDSLQDGFELTSAGGDPLEPAYRFEVASVRNTGTIGGRDRDGDGLSDYLESLLRSNPNVADTNHDRVDDGIALINDLPLTSIKGSLPRYPHAEEVSLHEYLRSALDQHGDAVRLGAEASGTDRDPDEWDSSELVQWAARQGGIDLVDGSWRQYQQLAKAGGDVGVDQALRTPGALVFRFVGGDPMGATRPRQSHVAISLGDGRVLEAVDGGVRIAEAGNRFTDAAVIHDFDREGGWTDWSAEADEVLARDAAALLPGEDRIELEPWTVDDLTGFDRAARFELAPPEGTTPDDALNTAAEPQAAIPAQPAATSDFDAIDASVDALFEPAPLEADLGSVLPVLGTDDGWP